MIALNRRAALLGLTTITTVASLPVRSAAAPAGPAALLRASFSDARAAAALGLAYLREHPSGATPARLVAELDMPASLATPEAVRDWLRTATRDDFACGRITTVAGWTLGRREAQAMGLVALG